MSNTIKQTVKTNNLKRTDVFDIGYFLSITSRTGVIFTGEFAGFVQGNYYLKKAEIIGKDYVVKSEWVLIDMRNIAHIHPKNVEVKKKEL